MQSDPGTCILVSKALKNKNPHPMVWFPVKIKLPLAGYQLLVLVDQIVQIVEDGQSSLGHSVASFHF